MVGVASQQRGEHCGVGGVAPGDFVIGLVWVAVAQHFEQVGGVGEVTVVPQSHGAKGGATEGWLCVAPG